MSTEIPTFRQLKLYVEELVPLDRDYLHILVGAAILASYLIWKAVKRRQFRGREVVGIVFVVAVVAELMDFWDDIAEMEHPNIAESLKDIILTVSVPAAAAIGQLILRKAIRFWRPVRR